MADHAAEYLRSAEEDILAEPPRRNVAYENARTAAELAGKSLLLAVEGHYPRKHDIGGILYQKGLLPEDLAPKRVARLLKHSTRADYGYMDPVDEEEIEEALKIARSLVTAASR